VSELLAGHIRGGDVPIPAFYERVGPKAWTCHIVWPNAEAPSPVSDDPSTH